MTELFLIDEHRTKVQSFSVNFEFPVHFTRDVFSPVNPVFHDIMTRREPDKTHRFIVFVDDGLLGPFPDLGRRIRAYAEAFADRMALVAEPVVISGGERCKNDLDVLRFILSELSAHGIDRHSYSVAIGGGAILDAVGFASAIFHRGIRHIRLPTTVLSQDDSGVGVKSAVNYFDQKNLIGSFSPPWAVVNDFDFIHALPAREKRAGMAEAVKVALIRDASFLHWQQDNAASLAAFSPGPLEALIQRSAALHMRQIGTGGDPFETGSARPLDFGHWLAHRLERMSRHAISHGEAVAIGIAVDTRYSVLAGLLEPGIDEKVASLLERLGFVLWSDHLRERDDRGRPLVVRGLEEFREHLGGRLTVTLLAEIGTGVEVNEMRPDLIEASLAWLAERTGAR